MIPNYRVPRLEVYQQLAVGTNTTDVEQAACIVGPSYEVYSASDGSAFVTSFGENEAKSIALPKPVVAGFNFTLDQKSVVVDGLNLRVAYGTLVSDDVAVSPTDSFVLISDAPIAGDTTSLAAGLAGMPVSLGDTVTLVGAADAELYKGTVMGLVSTDAAGLSTVFDGMRMSTPVVVDWATVTAVKVHRHVTGEIFDAADPATDAVEVTADGVTIKSALSADLTLPDGSSKSYVFEDNVGDYSISYRSMARPLSVEGIVSIHNKEDIEQHFGKVTPDNTLAYGCYCALMGAVTSTVYAVRTDGESQDAFMAALKKTSHNTATYTFVPLTQDVTIIRAIAAYNDTLSTPLRMRWRRTFMGIDYPGEFVLATKDTTGLDLQASVTEINNSDVISSVVKLSDSNSFNFMEIPWEGGTTTLFAGDIIKLTTLGAEYKVIATLSETEVLVEGAPDAPVATTTISCIKADTAENSAEYVVSIAKSFGSRRALVVWSSNPQTLDAGVSRVISNMFLACEIAGVSSRYEPQRGMTRYELTTVSAIPNMYTLFDDDQQDYVAANGVTVMTQAFNGSPCYVRHCLNTETDNGELYYEEQVTRNVDSIDLGVVGVIDPFIGRANVTPTAIIKLRALVDTYLDGRTSDSTDDLIGPSVVSWDNLTISQNPVYKDSVIVTFDTDVPLPMNGVQTYHNVIGAEVTF